MASGEDTAVGPARVAVADDRDNGGPFVRLALPAMTVAAGAAATVALLPVFDNPGMDRGGDRRSFLGELAGTVTARSFFGTIRGPTPFRAPRVLPTAPLARGVGVI